MNSESSSQNGQDLYKKMVAQMSTAMDTVLDTLMRFDTSKKPSAKTLKKRALTGKAFDDYEGWTHDFSGFATVTSWTTVEKYLES